MTPKQRTAVITAARERAMTAPPLTDDQRRHLTALFAPAAVDVVVRKRGRRRSA